MREPVSGAVTAQPAPNAAGGQPFSHGRAESAGQAVLLNRKDRPAFFGAPLQQSFIERLHGVHADHPATDALTFQLLGGGHRHRQNSARRNQGAVGAVPHHDGAADRERHCGFMHLWIARPPQPQIERTSVPARRQRGQLSLHRIARTHHRHIRQAAHNGDIFE